MDKIITLLDRVRLASVITVLAIIGGLIALAQGQIDYVEFAATVAAVSGGAGLLGAARNGAGHGTS
jgi:hypothetical protein